MIEERILMYAVRRCTMIYVRRFFDDDSKEKLKITSVCNKCQNFGKGDFYTLSIDRVSIYYQVII